MGTPGFLRSLSYQPSLRRAMGALHVRHIARQCYYLFTRPKGDVLRLGIDSIDGQFYVHSLEELRAMEAEILVEKETLELLVSTLRAGDVVYEIGASAGLSTVLLAKAGARVFAFEPMDENFARLQKNLDLNGMTKVRLFRKALADWGGKGKLYLADRDGISLGANLLRPLPGRGRYQMVEVEQGDQFRELENLPYPRAVHIDVEGCEYAVIRGLRQTLAQPTCQLVCCEIHPDLLPRGVVADAVLNLIRSLGFNRIERHSRYDTFHLVACKSGFRLNS